MHDEEQAMGITMIESTSLFDALAEMLEYPERDYADALDACEHMIAAEGDEVARPFLEFREKIAPLSTDELEELYVRTFEMTPTCTLETGYHLFGESYKRGEFLAHLREEESTHDIAQENQLPDFLPVLLRLATRIDEDDLRRDLIGACMLPAIGKITVALASVDGPYAHLLTTVSAALEHHLMRELEELAPEVSHA
jgi:nitrate reductase delta subunit